MPANPPAKLLIVDDEAAQMQALCDTLQDHGYETTGFASANEALAALRNRKFDLMLTDLMMPEMDGIALLRKARELDGNLVGVVMTGHGTIDSAVEAMKTGALDYLLKPFKLSVVLAVVARALALRALRLENEQLQQSLHKRTAELELANKELQAFSYSVSHDLRAPLRSIDGYSQMLLEDHGAGLPDEARKLLDKVISQAGRMQKLIQGLLNFFRLGRQRLQRQPVNLSALVKEVVDELRPERAGRSVEVRLGGLPDCTADPTLLKQVFVNLLSNAHKFTRHKNPAVIEVGSQVREGEQVYFVQDNGAGFDMKHAEKLFGVFQRLHPADEFEGTGIGLSIVQQIIQRHGGRIWAEAGVDQGAAFYFTLAAHESSGRANF